MKMPQFLSISISFPFQKIPWPTLWVITWFVDLNVGFCFEWIYHLPCKVISQCSNFKCLLVAAFLWPSFTNASFWIMGDLSLRELIKTRSSAKLCFALISICFFLLVPYYITLFPSRRCQLCTLYRFLSIWGMVFALNLKMSRGIGIFLTAGESF